MVENSPALAWPEWSKHLSPAARFFMGVPILGPQARIHRELCAQLRARTVECLEEWGAEPRRKALAKDVSRILSAQLGWPSTLFLPRDPFEVLCWDHSAHTIDDLRVESALLAIEKQVGTRLEDEFWTEARSLSFGDVVDRLLRR